MTDIRAQYDTSTNFTSTKKEYESEVDESVFRKLCVKNVATDTTEQELLEVFTKFGSVENIKLRVNTNIGPYAKYAVVLFSTHKEAKNCFDRVNGYVLNGRPLRIDLQKYTGQIEEEGESYNAVFANKNKFGNNKYYRKNIRTTHSSYLYTRYPNNKRIIKNDDLMNNENVKNGTGSYYYHQQEPIKRPRYNNLGIVTAPFKERRETGIFLNRYNNVLRKIYPNFSLKEFLMEYGGEQLVNSLNADDVSSEVITLVKQLISELLRKPKRIKLILCDHLKYCTEHVFVRPIVNAPVSTTITFETGAESEGVDLDLDVPGTTADMSTVQTRNIDKRGTSFFSGFQQDAPHMYANAQFHNTSVNEDTNKMGAYNSYGMANNGALGTQELQPKMALGNTEDMVINAEDKPLTWSGVLEMRNKETLRLVGYSLHNDEDILQNTGITHIYISHRKKLKCLPPVEAAYYFELMDENDQEIYNSYKDYFNSKERVGLAAADQGWYIYIIFPGSPIFEQFYPYKTNNGILGLVCYDLHTSEVAVGGTADEPIGKEHASSRDINQDDADFSHFNAQIHSGDPIPDQTQEKTGVKTMDQGNCEEKETVEKFFGNDETNTRNTEEPDACFTTDANVADNKNASSKIEAESFAVDDTALSNNSVKEETKPTEGVKNNEEDIPNWLNQFSSLAAYLVKK